MSGAPPRFTILLPTHNRADVLGIAIRSVLAQTEESFELLIVADGCTDGTREVVAGFNDPRIRFHDLPKAPHFGYANRNVALREARGRLVAFAPHDDILLPDHLALMGDLLDRTGASWGYSRPLWVSKDGVVVPLGTDLEVAEERRVFLEERNTIPAACIVHTADLLRRAGFWPEDVPAGADWVLWRRMLALEGVRIACLPQPTALHFTAAWKSGRHGRMPEVGVLIGMADRVAWWPAVLRQIPTDGPPQQVFWEAVSRGGPAWIAELRAAVAAVTNRIAWQAVQRWMPSLAEAEGALEKAVLEAREATASRDVALAELETTRTGRDTTSCSPTPRLRRFFRGLRALFPGKS